MCHIESIRTRTIERVVPVVLRGLEYSVVPDLVQLRRVDVQLGMAFKIVEYVDELRVLGHVAVGRGHVRAAMEHRELVLREKPVRAHSTYSEYPKCL